MDASAAIHSERHLVKPPPSWNLASVWDPRAGALHGITLVQPATLGELPFRIGRRMNDALAGRELFSDSPIDEARLMRMFDEARDDPAAIIRLTDASLVIAERATEFGWAGRSLERIRDEALRFAPRTHRVEADIRHLAQLWLMLGKEPAAQS